MDYLLRFLFYILKKIVIYGLVVGLLLTAFFMAMNMANIYIVINDGMDMRAQYYIKHEEEYESELPKFFTQGFLDRDEFLKETKYDDYDITRVDVKISVEWMWNLPWDDEAHVTVVQRIPIIEGYMKRDRMTEAQQNENKAIPAPAWQPARYQVTLKKLPNTVDGTTGWRIIDVSYLEPVADSESTPRPTRDPSVTPRPAITYTPSPRPSITPGRVTATPRGGGTPDPHPTPTGDGD